jgi:anti-anti-sigma factor
MSIDPFSAEIRNQGSAAIIDLRGEIDAFADQDLNNLFQEVKSTGATGILLNFSGVQYINSTGIALIVRLLGQARTAGIQITTYGLNSHYQEIFEITRLSDFLNIVPNEESALARLSTVS